MNLNQILIFKESRFHEKIILCTKFSVRFSSLLTNGYLIVVYMFYLDTYVASQCWIFFVWKWFLKEWELPLKVYCIHCSYCSINSVQLILLSIIHACKLKPIVALDSFNGINLWRRFRKLFRSASINLPCKNEQNCYFIL